MYTQPTPVYCTIGHNPTHARRARIIAIAQTMLLSRAYAYNARKNNAAINVSTSCRHLVSIGKVNKQQQFCVNSTKHRLFPHSRPWTIYKSHSDQVAVLFFALQAIPTCGRLLVKTTTLECICNKNKQVG